MILPISGPVKSSASSVETFRDLAAAASGGVWPPPSDGCPRAGEDPSPGPPPPVAAPERPSHGEPLYSAPTPAPPRRPSTAEVSPNARQARAPDAGGAREASA